MFTAKIGRVRKIEWIQAVQSVFGSALGDYDIRTVRGDELDVAIGQRVGDIDEKLGGNADGTLFFDDRSQTTLDPHFAIASDNAD